MLYPLAKKEYTYPEIILCNWFSAGDEAGDDKTLHFEYNIKEILVEILSPAYEDIIRLPWVKWIFSPF